MVRWAARLTGLVTFVILAATVPAAPPTAEEAVALLFSRAGVIGGFALGRWREGAGGLISVASLAPLSGWMIVFRSGPPGGPYFVLLTAPEFLFLLSHLLGRACSPAHRPNWPATVRVCGSCVRSNRKCTSTAHRTWAPKAPTLPGFRPARRLEKNRGTGAEKSGRRNR